MSDSSPLDLLHLATYRSEEEALKTYPLETPTYKRILRHKTTTIKNSSFLFDLSSNTEALANVRILGDNWNFAQIELGGVRISKIFKFMGLNSFYFLDNGHCFPFAERHNLGMLVVSDDNSSELVIEYDVVEITPKETQMFLLTNINYVSPRDISTGTTLIKIYLYRPASNLTAKFEKPVESVSLHVDISDILIPLTKVSDLEFTLNFEENTIDFSKINNIHLLINNVEDGNIMHCYVNEINIYSKKDGVYDLIS